jgi:hypothetical protein
VRSRRVHMEPSAYSACASPRLAAFSYHKRAVASSWPATAIPYEVMDRTKPDSAACRSSWSDRSGSVCCNLMARLCIALRLPFSIASSNHITAAARSRSHSNVANSPMALASPNFATFQASAAPVQRLSRHLVADLGCTRSRGSTSPVHSPVVLPSGTTRPPRSANSLLIDHQGQTWRTCCPDLRPFGTGPWLCPCRWIVVHLQRPRGQRLPPHELACRSLAPQYCRASPWTSPLIRGVPSCHSSSVARATGHHHRNRWCSREFRPCCGTASTSARLSSKGSSVWSLPKLVTIATFNYAQVGLDSHRAGEKRRSRPHDFKSPVYCGLCGSGMCVTRTINRWGKEF